MRERNVDALRRNLNPGLVDRAALRGYFEKYGDARFRAVEKGWDSAAFGDTRDNTA